MYYIGNIFDIQLLLSEIKYFCFSFHICWSNTVANPIQLYFIKPDACVALNLFSLKEIHSLVVRKLYFVNLCDPNFALLYWGLILFFSGAKTGIFLMSPGAPFTNMV